MTIIDYEIHCKDCNTKLHIGQSSNQKQTGWYMYRAKDNIGVLERYLIAHLGHNLEFDDSKKIKCKWTDGSKAINETEL